MLLNHRGKKESNPENEVRLAALFEDFASQGTTVEIHYPEDLGGLAAQRKFRQHKNLSGLHHILETPALVKKALEAERLGFDAVVQSNTFDSGVEAVRIPVVGLLRSSCHFAACLCERFAVIVPLESHVNYVHRLVNMYHMSNFVSAIKAIDMYDDPSGQHDRIVERTISLGRAF